VKEEIIQLVNRVQTLPPVDFDQVPREKEVAHFRDDQISIMGNQVRFPGEPPKVCSYFSVMGLPDSVERLIPELSSLFDGRDLSFSMMVTVNDLLCPVVVKSTMQPEAKVGGSTRYVRDDITIAEALELQRELGEELGPQMEGIWKCMYYLGYIPATPAQA